MFKKIHYDAKIFILMIVLLNSFCFSQSIKNDIIKGKSKQDKKVFAGSHWNRIGKRFGFANEKKQESKNPAYIKKNEFFSDNFLFYKEVPKKHELMVKLKQLISKFFSIYLDK